MRKLVPFHYNEIDKITLWLNELAKEGLCVETWGAFFVKLKEDEARDYVYQIDIDDSVTDPNYQRKLELEKQVWQYVQTIGTTRHHIYRTRNQGEKLVWEPSYVEKYKKYLQSNMIWLIIGCIVYIAIFIYLGFWRNGEYMFLTYMEDGWFYGDLLSLMILYSSYSWIGDAVRLHKLRKRLESDSTAPEKKAGVVSYGLKQMIAIGFMLAILVVFWAFDEVDENFDGMQLGLACLDLRTLEAEGFEISEITWDDRPGLNFGNRIVKKTGPFSEYLYEVNQYGTDINGGGVQISGKYFKVRPDSLANELLEQLIGRNTSYMYEHQYGDTNKILPEDYWTISEEENPAFTKLVVADAVAEEGPLMIFAQIEDVVIYLRYYGSLSAETFIEELTRLYM